MAQTKSGRNGTTRTPKASRQKTYTVRFGLKQKIVLALIILLLVPLTFLTLLSSSAMQRLGDQSVDDGAAALEEQAESNLQAIIEKKGALLDERFERFEAAIGVLANDAARVWAQPDFRTVPHSYYHNPAAIPTETVPGLTQDDRYGQKDISYDVSMFKIAPTAFSDPAAYNTSGTEAPFTYANLKTGVGAAINRTALLDPTIEGAYHSNTEFGWVYMGTEEGVIRMYPWNGPFEKDYDPRLRGWYQPWTDAADTDNDGYPTALEEAAGTDPATASSHPTTALAATPGIYWTAPYIDAGGLGLMITGSRGVFNTTTNALIGVVAVDVTIATINQEVLDISIGDQSHAFLIDRNGNTIAHRNFTAVDPELDWTAANQALQITQFESSTRSFTSALDEMTSATVAAIERVEYETDENYIAFAPLEKMGAVVGLVVPVEQIIEPTHAIDDSIGTQTASSVTAFWLAIVIVIVVVLVIGIVVVARVVGPIRELTTAAERISAGDLDVQIAVDSHDELGLLARSFMNIMTILRIGNIAYFAGDSEKAFNSYSQALELFHETGNRKGQAMCLNNLGNIYRNAGDNARAQDHYQRALALDRKLGNEIGIAHRLTNLGNVYKNREEYETAFQYYEQALELYEKLDDDDGRAKIANNIGIVHQALGDLDQAHAYFSDALARYETLGDKRGMSSCYNNLALVQKAAGDHTSALELLGKSLTLSEQLGDKRGIAFNLANLASLYEELGQTAKAAELKARSSQFVEVVAPQRKTVVFVIDRSGSMADDRIEAAKAGALEVLDASVYPNDYVGVISFASYSETVQELVEKRGNERVLERAIGKIRTGGMTAFYDAIGDALMGFQQAGLPGKLWVVALTDGEDNSSTKFGVHGEYGRVPLATYAEKAGINAVIIIIGVGNEVQPDLMKQLVGPNGRYIEVADSGQVDLGIRAAYKEVKEMFEESESVEGFTPEL